MQPQQDEVVVELNRPSRLEVTKVKVSGRLKGGCGVQCICDYLIHIHNHTLCHMTSLEDTLAGKKLPLAGIFICIMQDNNVWHLKSSGNTTYTEYNTFAVGKKPEQGRFTAYWAPEMLCGQRPICM